MRILVFNAGSSSLKFGLFDEDLQLLKGSFDRFGPTGCDQAITLPDGPTDRGHAPHQDIAAAITAVPALLTDHGLSGIDAIGHRPSAIGHRFAPAPVRQARPQHSDWQPPPSG